MSTADPTFVSAFEQLCRDAGVPATRASAEASLQAFRARDDVVAASVALIERATCGQARFHAASALRDACLARWRALPPAQRSGEHSLRLWALRVVAARPHLAPFERRAVLRISAVLFRRGYGEEPLHDSEAFLAQLHHAATSQQSPQTSVVAALECLDMCAEEFLIPSTCSSAAVPTADIDLFRRARPRFLSGAGHIVHIFRTVRESLLATLTLAPHLTPADLESRCEPALALLARTLTPRLINLEVDTSDSDDSNTNAQKSELSSVLRLEPSWTSLVEQLLEVTQICVKIIDIAKKFSAGEVDDPMDSARQVILGVSAVSRTSYPSPELASATLQLILSSIERQEWSSGSESNERIAYAEVWRQLACSHGLQGLAALGQQIFEIFAKRTCVMFIAIGIQQVQAAQDELFGIMDSADLLLETWASFSYETRASDPSIRQVLEPLFEEVFMEYLHLSMKSMIAEQLPPGAVIGGIAEDLEEEDLGFDDDSAEESRRNSAAALARYKLQKSTGILIQCVQDLSEKVFFRHSSENSQKATLAMLAQEDLYFAVHLISAVLADSSDGEVPVVPEALRADLAANASEPGKCAGNALFATLIRVATAETRMLDTKGAHCAEASPRVGRAILDALNRVSRTYLVPSERPEEAFNVIGGSQFAVQARGYSLKKALEAIRGRGFEPEMAEAAAVLLKSLSSDVKNYSDVQSSEVWQSLLSAGIESYQTLAPTAVEDIASSLASVLGDSAVSEQLVIPASRALVRLVTNQKQLPDSAERCIALINLLKGVARCQNVGPICFRDLVASLSGFDGSVTHCTAAFQPDRYDVARTAIRLAVDMVSGRLSLLSNEDAHKLLTNVMNLVHLHSVSIAQHTSSIPLDECVMGVERILNLLQYCLDEQPPDALSEHLFRGLSSLLPSMSESFLAYPAVKKSYFDFITCLAAQYPSPVLRLPYEFCAKIFQSIKLELFSRDPRAERKGLEAVTALAREFAVNDDTQHESTSRIEAELVGLLEVILLNLAHGSAFTDNLETASDSILHLLFFKGAGFDQHYEAIGRKLIANGGNQAEMADILNTFRDRANAASVWQGFKNIPAPQASPRPPIVMRRLATRNFKEAVFEFSVRCRDALLRQSA